jgi:hypothetical protein
MASSGDNFDALTAGKTPVRNPTNAENDAMKTRNGIGNEKSAIDFPPKLDAARFTSPFNDPPITRPKTIPITPPRNPTITDSDKKSIFIS